MPHLARVTAPMTSEMRKDLYAKLLPNVRMAMGSSCVLQTCTDSELLDRYKELQYFKAEIATRQVGDGGTPSLSSASAPSAAQGSALNAAIDMAAGTTTARSAQPDDGVAAPRGEKQIAAQRHVGNCVICDGGDDEGLVLLCDECDDAYHAHCVGFEGTLQGDWLCPSCEDA